MGGEAGTRGEQFLASPGLYISSSPSKHFPERCHRPLGRLRAPFLHPPSPAAMGAAVGAQAAWGRGLCPWEDAAGDDLVGKKRRNDPPATGVCACERERKRGKKVSFPQNSAVQHSKRTRCGARRRSVASP